ncbi:ATP-binding protein [Streptomyces sp. NPDC092952]|uniref:ATP-binding protein n=1 Tax=Streptomyces sp. NPDC092952 TaxID=3366018 RepID=UPI003816386A
MIDLPRALPPVPCAPLCGPPPTLLLASERKSVRYARDFVRAFIVHHSPDAPGTHIDAVVLVTSELVTNAYRYGTEPDDLIRVVLDVEGGRTRVEVHDPVRRTPRRRFKSTEGDDESTRGRGLVILDALCPGQWGFAGRPFGKFVWAEIRQVC